MILALIPCTMGPAADALALVSTDGIDSVHDGASHPAFADRSTGRVQSSLSTQESPHDAGAKTVASDDLLEPGARLGQDLVHPAMQTIRYLTFLVWLPLVLQAARTHETNPLHSPKDLAKGQRLYRIHCGVCHGMEGKTGRGARLAKRSYVRGDSDADLFDLIESGIPGTDMPGLWMDEDDIWRILLFVRTFAATAGGSCEPGTGDPVAGKDVFTNKGACLACHTVGMAGGRLGPDMSYAGVTFSNEQLLKALLEPHADIADRYRTVRIVTADGERVEGVRMNENGYHIFVMDRSEAIRSFRKHGLESIEQPAESLMPAYGDLLSDSETADLVAYLCTLRGPSKENER